LNMYSTFYMPGLYYFISHLPISHSPLPEGVSSDKVPVGRAWWTYAPLDASSKKILQALGVRYVFQSLPERDETRPPDDAVLRRQFAPMTVGKSCLCYLRIQ